MHRIRGVCCAAATAVVLVGAALAGCASTPAGADAADMDAIAEVASAAGIAPDLVYTTEVTGYDLAPQSVGSGAGEGLQATWFNQDTGAMVTLRSDRGELTTASCEALPLWDAPDADVTCAEEEGLWRRSSGDVQEYVAVRDDALIWITGSNAPQDDLLAAATAVRVPSDAELVLLFSDLPASPSEPIERGDLPENGDGAPIDPVGPGG